jgi:hypothetical protein
VSILRSVAAAIDRENESRLSIQRPWWIFQPSRFWLCCIGIFLVISSPIIFLSGPIKLYYAFASGALSLAFAMFSIVRIGMLADRRRKIAESDPNG